MGRGAGVTPYMIYMCWSPTYYRRAVPSCPLRVCGNNIIDTMFSPNPAPSTAGSGYTRARTPQGGMTYSRSNSRHPPPHYTQVVTTVTTEGAAGGAVAAAAADAAATDAAAARGPSSAIPVPRRNREQPRPWAIVVLPVRCREREN